MQFLCQREMLIDLRDQNDCIECVFSVEAQLVLDHTHKLLVLAASPIATEAGLIKG